MRATEIFASIDKVYRIDARNEMRPSKDIGCHSGRKQRDGQALHVFTGWHLDPD